MTWELAVTPSGRIMALHPESVAGEPLRRVVEAFAEGTAAGLFELAARKTQTVLPVSAAYWRDFAARYLSALCQTPAEVQAEPDVVPPPTAGELASLHLSLPPMPGAEYVSTELLEQLWRELDVWTRSQIAAGGQGLAGFIQARAPLWHQVGRVCFHLAENKRDPAYPFAFLATYAPSVAGGGQVRYKPLSKALEEYAGAKNKNALVQLLSPVSLAAKASPLIQQLVETGDIYQPLAWTPPQAYQFLQSVPLFEDSGILVRLPDWWKKRPRPRVSVTIGGKKQKKFDAQGMLDFQVHLALGDQKLSEAEWQQLLESQEGLVFLRGQWVEVDRDKLTQALEHWQEVQQHAEDGVSFIEGMRLLAGASQTLEDDAPEAEEQPWSFVNAGQWLGGILEGLRDPRQLQQTRPGAELKATLREYQQTGLNWLSFLTGLGLGACLADDMGLGKTVQVLALLLTLKKKRTGKPSLLVLPASLLANWKAEIEKFAPSLRSRFVHPAQATAAELARLAKDPASELQDIDVVLTTYGMLLRQSWLLEVDWQLAVLDEAQAIKNPGTRQTKAVKRLRAESRIALTGTPVENRLGDLWSLFDFLSPGLLGSQQRFKQFIKSLEAREQDRYAPLRRLVGPYVLRRLKTDKNVIADLPDKTEVHAWCGLGKRQAALYTKLVQEMAAALQNQDGIQRRGLVLAYLMRFKQLCNHPAQLLGDGDYTPDESGKFLRLGELAEEIASRQEKALVFTQFRELTDPLAGFLAESFGRGGLILHGNTPVKQRQQLVEEFQREDGPPFFVLSLKAGGTGLNLTAASHVIHFDRWWNPAVENQATDRAFRIGQKRNVLVHKFVCQGTVEEKIDTLITEKTQLATDLLEGSGEQLLTEMSNAELIQLVSLDLDRVQF